jgi:hypothetical protein
VQDEESRRNETYVTATRSARSSRELGSGGTEGAGTPACYVARKRVSKGRPAREGRGKRRTFSAVCGTRVLVKTLVGSEALWKKALAAAKAGEPQGGQGDKPSGLSTPLVLVR